MREAYNPLQLRELFHLEFLRWFNRRIKGGSYAVKGGTNLRFFFHSLRYSEDMDLDIKGAEVAMLKDKVMEILTSDSFQHILRPFGIENLVAPDIAKAKQTQTTQRFKIHLITSSGEDLFTKVEFSRRGFKGDVIVQPVLDHILRSYKLSPLLVPHYDIRSTVAQKIEALATRSVIQARDIFDLYILSSQYETTRGIPYIMSPAKLKSAYENLFEISFAQFKDTVITYLSEEDQGLYDSSSAWDDIQLKVSNFINELKGKNA